MLLILFRHGIAVPQEDFDGPDADRPLTSEGRDRTHRAALGLWTQVRKPDFLVSSPKLRARQTAQIARDALGRSAPAIEIWPELAHDDFVPLISRLRHLEEKDAQTVVCVGHEPNLSHFASQSLTGYAEAINFDLRKAGAIALEISFEPMQATLLWQLTPKQLRALGQ